MQHHDWLPTFCAMAGDADVPHEAAQGLQACGKTFKVHIDGYNLLDFLTKKGEKSPRRGARLLRRRRQSRRGPRGNWKAVFMEQRARGTLEIWAEPFTVLRIPKLFNLRTDPYERADITSNSYWEWYVQKGYMIMAAQAVVQPFLDSFKEYPPRQKAASFTLDQALEKMAASFNSGH